MREPIALSVVIPDMTKRQDFPATLRDLRTYLDRDGRRVEVIVVDDGSTDSTSGVVAIRSGGPPDSSYSAAQKSRQGLRGRSGVVNAADSRPLRGRRRGDPVAELARLKAHLVGGARVAIGSGASGSRDAG